VYVHQCANHYWVPTRVRHQHYRDLTQVPIVLVSYTFFNSCPVQVNYKVLNLVKNLIMHLYI